MAVLLLIAVAAVLLGHGYLTESRSEVIAAGIVSLVAAGLIVVDRVRARRPVAPRADDAADPAEADERVAAEEPETDPGGDVDVDLDADAAVPESVNASGEVVFVPGRLTFHLAGCTVIADKPTSSAARGELEKGGMQPCRRCIPDEPGADAGRKLRLA